MFVMLISLLIGQEETTTIMPVVETEIPITTTIASVNKEESLAETVPPVAIESNTTTEQPKLDDSVAMPKEVEPEQDMTKEDESNEKVQPSAELEPQPPIEQNPPRIVFITQHIRDPTTGVIYTRQVPLVNQNFMPPNAQALPQEPIPKSSEQDKQQESSPFDPLGQYTDSQKKRQFFQDILMGQLTKFESELEPMVEREMNLTEKNDMEELLGAVADMRHTLEMHQIFNISEIMDNWKQGKLASESSEQPIRSTTPRRPMSVRTLILMPQSRFGSPQLFNSPPYGSERQSIPILHIRPRGPPFHIRQTPHFGMAIPPEQIEPSARSNENEYSNTNEIYGF
ncbi:hypothetical protein BLOT_000461 [Blomia tropicalis]|nr:hypothetical protein BLOT_000461 [Blomia tropicalis]